MTRISLTIPLEMSAIPESLTAAVANGSLLQSAQSNIVALLNGTTSEIAPLAVQELVDAGAWEELNVFFSPRNNDLQDSWKEIYVRVNMLSLVLFDSSLRPAGIVASLAILIAGILNKCLTYKPLITA